MNKILEDLKKLKDVYNETEEFVIGDDLKVKLKLLSSEEETEVHSYAMQYSGGLAYLFSIKRETVTRSIIALNNRDISEYIEELNDKGIVEKVQRHSWLRNNVTKGWSQILVDNVWNHYASLMSKAEAKITSGIKTEEVKKDASE